MTEQEIADLKAKTAQLEADLKVAKDNEAKALADKNTTVEELKTLRTTKQEVEAKLALAESKLTPGDSSQGNVEEQVNKVLAAKEEKDLAEMRANAERKFKESHTEFHPDNDPGGIKYAAFQAKLARLNLSGLKTEEQLNTAFGEALILMNPGRTNTDGTPFNPYAATSKNSSGDPKGQNNNKLDPKEMKLIGSLGWTEERYLKLKKSRPHYVETMLQQFK